MTTYTYRARDATGKPVKGTIEAVTEQEVIDKLRKMGYMATQVSEALPAIIRVETIFDKLKGVSRQELIIFYVQLSNMMSAGVDILSSLKTLGNQTENKKLKEIIGGVSKSIEAGESFSTALSKYPRVFPFVFISMVKAGEASGKLETVLDRFVQFTEHQADLRQKIRGALFYPLILLSCGIAATLFIVTFLIPKFTEIFLKSGMKLPLPTLILSHIGIAIKQFWYVLILLIILCAIAIRYYIKTESGRFNLDRLKLKLPVLGPLFRRTAISRFSRTLATLVASGVPILKCLDITQEVIANEVLAHIIRNVRIAVEKGEKISESLKISEEFPQDTIQMIAVGEETGNLAEMFNKIANFYDMTLEYSLKKLVTVIEPLLLVIIGSMIGFIMASILLPMFDMIKILRR